MCSLKTIFYLELITIKKSWILSKYFLCFLFAFSVLIIPLIFGIILLFLSHHEDMQVKGHEQTQEYLRQKQIADDEAARAYQISTEDAYRTQKFAEEDAAHNSALENMQSELKNAQEEYAGLMRETLLASVNIEPYREIPSVDIKNQIALLLMRQKDMVTNESAYVIDSGKRSHTSVRVLANLKKQIMRCFNSECATIIDTITIKNVDTSRNKMQRSFEQINKIFEQDSIQIVYSYLESKFEELTLLYAFMVALEEERETQRAIREEMQEEERVRREIEREKIKIEKEEQQFTNEINKLMQYLQKAGDIEKQLYVEKIKELEEKLKLVASDKENVLEREQNTRAGFVYIISNIGSFGENIYKIGVTRRLEPMDRIRELSSASVPFSFDVHAMIFSHDAPKLETVLHNTFKANRVNHMNTRKEFFNIDLTKIKEVVVAEHNSTVNFEDILEAMEYRETIKLLNA